MIAAITLFLIVTLSALITRIAAIALEHTGLSTDAARFQSRSAYTGAGFTTSESEGIMNHPVRRKIIFNLMLVGNAGIVTVISSLILTFVLPNTLSSKLYGLLIIVVGMTVLWWAVKSKFINRVLSKLIRRMLKKYTNLEIQDYAAVLHLKDNYRISEKKIDDSDWLCNNTLSQLALNKEGITVLGIDRKGDAYYGSPLGEFKILPNDVITVYGKAGGIKSVFERKKNKKAVEEHKKYMQKEIHRKTEQVVSIKDNTE